MRGRGGVVFLTLALCASLMAAMVELATADEIPVLDESDGRWNPELFCNPVVRGGRNQKRLCKQRAGSPHRAWQWSRR